MIDAVDGLSPQVHCHPSIVVFGQQVWVGYTQSSRLPVYREHDRKKKPFSRPVNNPFIIT